MKRGARRSASAPLQSSEILKLSLVWFIRLVWFRRLVLFGRFLLPLMFLLLPLFQLLLLLIVFLLELLQLLLLPLLKLLLLLLELLLPLINLRLLSLLNLRLLPLLGLLLSLIDLRPSLRIGVVLLQLLALLNLLLLDSLTFLVLFRPHILELLLVLLLELWVDVAGIVRSRRRRTIVVNPRIARIRRSIPRPVGLVRRVRVVWRAWAVCVVPSRRAIWVALRHVCPSRRRVLRRSLPDRWRHLDVGMSIHGAFRLSLTHFRDCRRSASVGLHDLLLLGERHRSGRRSRLRHNRTAHDC